MTDTEAMPKPEEVAETEEATDIPVPVEQKDLVADDSSSAKSPSKSPAKTPKKAAEATNDSSSAKSPAKSPIKFPKKAAEEKSSPAKNAKTSPSKSPVKSPKKSKKEESEEEEEEDEEIEEKKGILDMPLVIEGKRKRESTSFLKVEENLSSKHKAPVVAGSGTALEDIPFVAHQIEAEKKVDALRPLYRICYGTKGKTTVLRKELKKFNGFSFAKDSDEYKRKQVLVSKLTKADLSHARRILGLHPSSKKEEEVQTIMDFLVKPHDEGRSVPKKAAKRKSAGKDKTPAKKSKKASPSKKKSTSKETVDTESDEDEKSSASGEDEEEEKETKETPKKAAPKKRKAVEQKTKTPSKKAKKAESEDDDEEKEDDHSVTSSSDSSDKEKKHEKPEQKPSDKEVKAKIVDLLKTFDLTAVSMKQMVLAVCNAFPDHPTLNERTSSIKTFIKDAIKEEEEA